MKLLTCAHVFLFLALPCVAWAQTTGLRNVRDYGAVGNGIADDTAAIQNVANLGGGVFFPAGDYKVNGATRMIYVRSNNRFVFDGEARIIVPAHGTAQAFLFWADGVDDWSMQGGCLVGERVTSTGEGVGIYVAGCSRVKIDGITIKNFALDGIVINANASKVSDEVSVVNSTVSNCRRNGISVCAAKNVLVSNNFLRFTNGAPPQCGLDVEPDANWYVDGITITGNLASGNSGDGFKIQQGMGGTSFCQNVIMSGNTAKNNVVNGFTVNNSDSVSFSGNNSIANGQDGLSVSAGSTSAAISGGSFAGNGRYGIIIASSTCSSITGVSTYANAKHGIYAGQTHTFQANATAYGNGEGGIFLDACVNAAITGTFSNNTGVGVNIRGGQGVSLVGAVIRNNTSYGILTENALNMYTIVGCIAQNNGTGLEIRDIATGPNKAVADNVTTP